MAEKYGSLLKGTRSNTLEREREIADLAWESHETE